LTTPSVVIDSGGRIIVWYSYPDVWHRKIFMVPRIPWVVCWSIASQQARSLNGGPTVWTSIQVQMGWSPPVVSIYLLHGFSKEERCIRLLSIEISGMKYCRNMAFWILTRKMASHQRYQWHWKVMPAATLRHPFKGLVSSSLLHFGSCTLIFIGLEWKLKSGLVNGLPDMNETRCAITFNAGHLSFMWYQSYAITGCPLIEIPNVDCRYVSPGHHGLYESWDQVSIWLGLNAGFIMSTGETLHECARGQPDCYCVVHARQHSQFCWDSEHRVCKIWPCKYVGTVCIHSNIYLVYSVTVLRWFPHVLGGQLSRAGYVSWNCMGIDPDVYTRWTGWALPVRIHCT
jgi:hypothetical protein